MFHFSQSEVNSLDFNLSAASYRSFSILTFLPSFNWLITRVFIQAISSV